MPMRSWKAFNPKRKRQIKVIFWFIFYHETKQSPPPEPVPRTKKIPIPRTRKTAAVKIVKGKATKSKIEPPPQTITNAAVSINEKRREARQLLEAATSGLVSLSSEKRQEARKLVGWKAYRKITGATLYDKRPDALDHSPRSVWFS